MKKRLLSSLTALAMAVSFSPACALAFGDANAQAIQELRVNAQGSGNTLPQTHIVTVTFDANGGKVSESSLSTDHAGKLLRLPTPTREGYTFWHWYKLTADGGRSVVTPDTEFKEAVTVYAHWTPQITLNANGGKMKDAAGDEVTERVFSTDSAGKLAELPTPTHEGYDFQGWYQAADDGGAQIAADTTFEKPMTVYAQWAQKTGSVSHVTDSTTHSKPPETAHPFSDVDSGAWYEEAAQYVYKEGLMRGNDKMQFCPESPLSRAMLAQILYNRAGQPHFTSAGSFSDVVPNAWYANAVLWAAEQGIVTGYGNGLFGPDNAITREQMAVMLWRYAGSPMVTGNELRFSDAGQIGSYALHAIRWAVEQGILHGDGGGRLNPAGKASRGEAAQILMNAWKK